MHQPGGDRVVGGQGGETGLLGLVHLRKQASFPGQVAACCLLVAGVAVVHEEQEVDAGGVCQRIVSLDLRPFGQQRLREQACAAALGFGQFAHGQFGDPRVIGDQHQAPRRCAHLRGQLRADRPLRPKQMALAVRHARAQVQQQGAVELCQAGFGQGHSQ
ncbi:hypothetical protein D3C76_892240 [compost metagenome]